MLTERTVCVPFAVGFIFLHTHISGSPTRVFPIGVILQSALAEKHLRKIIGAYGMACTGTERPTIWSAVIAGMFWGMFRITMIKDMSMARDVPTVDMRR